MAQAKIETPAEQAASVGLLRQRGGLPRLQELGLIIVIVIMAIGLSILGYVAA
ncbi:MAG TPA: hypothetical protein VHX86_19000 [Tepidisphaeraceae bacterium]|jgi:hypothetical protein|nr:hypothetical protein [Tepidisphaeraceae bacterium]